MTAENGVQREPLPLGRAVISENYPETQQRVADLAGKEPRRVLALDVVDRAAKTALTGSVVLWPRPQLVPINNLLRQHSRSLTHGVLRPLVLVGFP